jgi:hypothetical protein
MSTMVGVDNDVATDEVNVNDERGLEKRVAYHEAEQHRGVQERMGHANEFRTKRSPQRNANSYKIVKYIVRLAGLSCDSFFKVSKRRVARYWS